MADFFGAMDRFDVGQKQVQNAFNQAARQQAGRAMAGGDAQGGVNMLNRAGLLDESGQLQDRQFRNEELQYRREGRQQEQADAKRKAGLETIGKAATWLKQRAAAATQAGGPQAAQQALAADFDQVVPFLGDVDPQTLQQYKAAIVANPGLLDVISNEAAKELEIVNRGNGAYDVVNKGTGAVVRSAGADPKALPPHWVERKKADGSTEWIDLNEAGAAPTAAPSAASPSGAPQAAAPTNDAVWQSMIQRESGGRPGVTGPQTPYGRAQGMTQMLPATAQAMAQKLGVPWRPDLMTDKTPEAAAYQQQLGRAYFDEGLQKYGGDPSKAASYYHGGPNEALWGPKTRAYAQAVTGGVSGSSGVSAPPGMAGGAGGDTLGRRVVPGSEAKPGENTAVDPNVVKGLIEGRITPPTQKAAAAPYWQAQLQAATAQDPTFDGVNFQARAKTRADFTSGKSAVNITALNTVVGHLYSLDKAIDNLGNAGPGGALNFGPLNSLNNRAANTIAQISGTDTRLRDFETKKEAVANELTRVFRGTGGAEADIQAWKAQLNSAGSPDALHGVVRAMAELINSRLEALGEQYQQGMGTTKDPLTLLTPDKQKAFRRLQGEEAPAAPQRPQAQTGAPVRVKSVEQARALKPGTPFVTPDGRRKIR